MSMRKAAVGMTNSKFELAGPAPNDKVMVIIDGITLGGQERVRMTTFSEVDTVEGMAFEEKNEDRHIVEAERNNKKLTFSYGRASTAAKKASKLLEAGFSVFRKTRKYDPGNPGATLNSFFHISGKKGKKAGYRDKILQETLARFHKQLESPEVKTLDEAWSLFEGDRACLVYMPDPEPAESVIPGGWLPIQHPDTGFHYNCLNPRRLSMEPYKLNKVKNADREAAEKMRDLIFA